jgi:hypothetical protein
MMDDAHRARRKETALPLSCRPHSADLAAKLAVPSSKKRGNIPLIAGTSIKRETQHGTDNTSKHGSLVRIGTD